MENLTVSLIQAPTIWENPEQNRNQINEIILHDLTDQTDLILLPEMWTTGFSMRPEVLSEKMDGPTVHWMNDLADKRNCAIAGSLIIEENNSYYNRLVFVMPKKSIAYYDKRHCFGLAKEDQHFTPGSGKLVFDWRGWKICPLICYDLRFPVWSRNTEEYDLLLFVAQFPEKRRNAWLSLLAARAIENVAYVAGANSIGVDGNGIVYSGDSGIWDYEGISITNLGLTGGCISATLSKSKLHSFRRAYPFLKDQDKFKLL